MCWKKFELPKSSISRAMGLPILQIQWQARYLLPQKEDGNKKSIDKSTVSALLDASIQPHAWISYLSACSTAEVKTQKLADESLHLTSAF